VSPSPPSDEGPCYEIRLAGHLDDRWSAWFDGLAITHEGDGTTTLRGPVADQAGLHGLLTKVRDLGAPLISLAPVDTTRSRSDSEPLASSARSFPDPAAVAGIDP